MKQPREVGARAEELFVGGYNCCESVLTALAEAMGTQCGCIPAVATGMGGGVGHTGSVCGAVSGAAMAVGLAVDRLGLPDHSEEKDRANELVTEFRAAFEEEFGTILCGDLIGFDFTQPDWRAQYAAQGCGEKCTGYVSFAAEWIAERLSKEEP